MGSGEEKRFILSLPSYTLFAKQPPLRRLGPPNPPAGLTEAHAHCEQFLFSQGNEKAAFSCPSCPCWGVFWCFPGSPSRPAGGCSLSFHELSAQLPRLGVAGAQLAPHGGAQGGCLGGRPVRAGFLGPPPVLSSVATSEGPFVCPFIQKSGCNCVGHKAPVALTSHPCLWPSQERVSQAPHEGCLLPLPGSQTPDPLLLHPRPVHGAHVSAPPPWGGHWLTGLLLPTPGHTAGGSHAKCWGLEGPQEDAVFRGFAGRQAVQGGWSLSHPKRQLESGARLGSGQEGMSAGHVCHRREKGGGRGRRKGSFLSPLCLALSP